VTYLRDRGFFDDDDDDDDDYYYYYVKKYNTMHSIRKY